MYFIIHFYFHLKYYKQNNTKASKSVNCEAIKSFNSYCEKLDIDEISWKNSSDCGFKLYI